MIHATSQIAWSSAIYQPAPNNHVAKKQVFPNSCGAAALLCAAKELGINKIPVLSGSMSEHLGVDTLELDNRCESDLYRITSGCTTVRQGQSNLQQAGYSMPDNIVIAGRLLGLDMRMEKSPGLFSTGLNWLYPEIENNLKGIGCPIDLPGPALGSNEVKLEAMAVSCIGLPIGLHWVVSRADGSYMDPATGENQKNFSALNAGVKQAASRVLGYSPSGISIVAALNTYTTV
ncbi:hypothetical protein IFT37_13600 [Pseudomonas fluorescens]|uniref:hypothetical protein n=1 Tax=Pseudomonas fluorescens group TaxID=136843 RepID=UPI00177D7C4A|nr:hypothetical protein [Pseudomonas fluorescens]MBD8150582.1 hypothetical protein [Pseudomonas fluorescens]MBD8179373.1 hypothetical protein [Pseudomonas fluorescens]MBD8746137.1 hypothetical protein [Pseudomonas fluorescens]MBD8753191.1 hypothetical protein [Pseudomonas fluorescens]MBD8762226.1 hypothetical protein [Pseudomonas fluorescens]